MAFDLFKKLKKDKGLIHSRSEDKKLLRKKYQHFVNLLSDNNAVLEIMADMEEKFAGEFLFDRQYIDSSSRTLAEKVYSIIENLNALSEQRYLPLYDVFKNIQLDIEGILTRKTHIPVSDFTIPLDCIDKEMVAVAGGKNANLGEVKNRIKLPVPDGFVITAHAFKTFMEHNRLTDEINKRLYGLDLKKVEELHDLSQEIHGMIMRAEIPAELRQSISDSCERITGQSGNPASLSVRSSAVQEDGEFSFAGQYATALGITGSDSVMFKYKEILASLFTPRAIFYYRTKGFTEDDMVMAVGVMQMIDSRMSGVMYSHDPNDPQKNVIIINAVWGLGTLAVDGQVSPYTYVISRHNNVILEKKGAMQTSMMTVSQDKGLRGVDLPEELERASCLRDEQVLKLAEYAHVIEKHYNRPQDIEWAIDRNNTIYILQTRPLRISTRSTKIKSIPTHVEGHRILINKGTIACKGIGSGKAFFVRGEEDLMNFPPGAVLVARHTSPKFVMVMDRASAIVTDIGSATGHMASLSREFQVPTLLNTNIATAVIAEGQELTVDAVNSNIYEGKVQEIIDAAAKREEHFRNTPLFKTLRKVLKRAVPLHLVDPAGESFSPEHCKTFHDITRFSHEKAMAEMFKISDREDVKSGDTVRLILKIPLEIKIIDLGNGVEEGYKKITPENIRSRPLHAFLKGLISVKWPGPKPVDVRGIPSASQEGRLYEKSFAMASEDYMNFSIRLGYHLSTVEAFSGRNINDNYIQFFFKGGGASADRRMRRTVLIHDILQKMDFTVKKTGSVLEAKITKYEEDAILKKLEVLGRLTVFTKQLDMALIDDAMGAWFKEEFLREYYSAD